MYISTSLCLERGLAICILEEEEKTDENLITSEKPRKLHWDLSRYLLCAYENTTLALACAWREIKGLTSQSTSTDNGKEKQDEDEDKVDRFTDQSDIFPSTCYVQMINKH